MSGHNGGFIGALSAPRTKGKYVDRTSLSNGANHLAFARVQVPAEKTNYDYTKKFAAAFGCPGYGNTQTATT